LAVGQSVVSIADIHYTVCCWFRRDSDLIRSLKLSGVQGKPELVVELRMLHHHDIRVHGHHGEHRVVEGGLNAKFTSHDVVVGSSINVFHLSRIIVLVDFLNLDSSFSIDFIVVHVRHG